MKQIYIETWYYPFFRGGHFIIENAEVYILFIGQSIKTAKQPAVV